MVLSSFWLPSSKNKSRVAVICNQGSILYCVKLTGVRMALGHINEFAAVGISGLELQHGGTLFTYGAPSQRIEMTCGTIDYHELCIRVAGAVIGVGAAIVCKTARKSFEMAFYEDISMSWLDVAHP